MCGRLLWRFDRFLASLLTIRFTVSFGAQLFRQALLFYFIDNLHLSHDLSVFLFTVHGVIGAIFRIAVSPIFDHWLMPELGLWTTLVALTLRSLIALEWVHSLPFLLFTHTVTIGVDIFAQGNLRILMKRHIATLGVVPAKPFENIVFGLDYGVMNLAVALATAAFMGLRWLYPFPDANRLALACALMGFVGAGVAWATATEGLRRLESVTSSTTPTWNNPARFAQSQWQRFISVLTDRSLWRFTAFGSLLVATNSLCVYVELTMPFVMQRTIDPHASFAAAQIINPVMCIIIAPLLQILLSHYRTYYVIWAGVGVAVVSVFPLLVMSAATYTPYVLFMIISSLAEGIWSVRYESFSMQMPPKGQEMMYNALSSIPPLILGTIVSMSSAWLLAGFCPSADHCNAQALWAVIAAIAALSPLGMLLFKRVLNIETG